MIKNLKDATELAWAAHEYFHLADLNYTPDEDSKDGKRLKYFRNIQDKQYDDNFHPTLIDILNIEHKYYKDGKTGKLKDGLFDDKFLAGDFSQLKQKDSLKDMIYSFISQIQNLVSLLHSFMIQQIKNIY